MAKKEINPLIIIGALIVVFWVVQSGTLEEFTITPKAASPGDIVTAKTFFSCDNLAGRKFDIEVGNCRDVHLGAAILNKAEPGVNYRIAYSEKLGDLPGGRTILLTWEVPSDAQSGSYDLKWVYSQLNPATGKTEVWFVTTENNAFTISGVPIQPEPEPEPEPEPHPEPIPEKKFYCFSFGAGVDEVGNKCLESDTDMIPGEACYETLGRCNEVLTARKARIIVNDTNTTGTDDDDKEVHELVCDDEIDNDNDDKIDCADSDCSDDDTCKGAGGGLVFGLLVGVLIAVLVVVFRKP